MFESIKKEFCTLCHTLAAGEGMPDDAFFSVKKEGYFVVNDTRCPLRELTEDRVILMDEEGHVVEGDAAGVDPYFSVHRVIYAHNNEVTTVIHPRSRWNSIWAQIGRSLSPSSFLYCRHFSGEIPCTGSITLEPGEDLYTVMGRRVEDAFVYKGIQSQGAVIVCNDSGMVWGKDAAATVRRAIALEEICFRAIHTAAITQGGDYYVSWEVSQQLLERDGEEAK